MCKQEQRTLYGVAKREPIQVPCTVESDPAEVNFRWMFNNSFDLVPMKSFDQPTSANLMTSVATYAPLNKYGYGQLLCWASNKLGIFHKAVIKRANNNVCPPSPDATGEQSVPCVFNVIPAGQPQPLRNCAVRNQSADGLVVNCEPGDDGGLEQQFFLEVFQAEQGQLWANLTLTEAPVEFIVTDVPVATTFVLVLYASNAKGRSNYVTLSASTMPPGSRGSGLYLAMLHPQTNNACGQFSIDTLFSTEFLKFTADFGIKPVMYILVAVVSSLVVAAIAIMIVSKVRTINKSKGTFAWLTSLVW